MSKIDDSAASIVFDETFEQEEDESEDQESQTTPLTFTQEKYLNSSISQLSFPNKDAHSRSRSHLTSSREIMNDLNELHELSPRFVHTEKDTRLIQSDKEKEKENSFEKALSKKTNVRTFGAGFFNFLCCSSKNTAELSKFQPLDPKISDTNMEMHYST